MWESYIVADKRTVRKSIHHLNQVKTWQLLVLAILVGFVAATFLRLNSVGMIERRTAVLAADKSGDDQQTRERLYDLQRYSAGHMNASTGPIYLQGKYDRDTAGIINSATSGDNPNGNVYAKADEVCKPRFGAVYSLAYQQCFLDEVSKYPPAENPSDRVTLPDPNEYRHSYVSPMLSLDFAGLSVMIALIIFMLIFVRLITLAVLHAMLKRNYRDL